MLLPGLFAALIAASPSPAELHPAGPWRVDQQPAGCRATRGYSGDANVTLGFETHLTGSATIMLVSAPRSMLPEGTGSIPVTAAGHVADVHYGAFDGVNPAMRLIRIFPDQAMLDAIGSASSIQVGALALPAPDVGGALRAVRNCTDAMLSSWGVDPRLWREGKLAGFRGSPQSWFTTADAQAIVPRATRSAKFVLLITTTADGRSGTCRAVDTPDQRMGEAVCALVMRRGRFTPPLGADGQPLTSYVVLPVVLTR